MDIQLGKMLSPAAKVGTTPKPYLRNANVQWGRFDLADVALMDFNDREQAKFRLRRGDLLVCEGGEPGRSAVWGDEMPEVYYQKALHRLRPNADGVNPHFMMYRLWLGAQSGEFGGSQAKTTIAHLPAVRLHGLRIALPPLAEQRRIAARLAEQLAAVERARKAAAAKAIAAQDLGVAIVRAVFSGDAVEQWPVRPLSDAGGIVSGVALGRQLWGKPTRPVPYLRVANVKDGFLALTEVKETEATDDEIAELTLRRGDLLLTEGGDPDKLGRGCLWEEQLPLCVHQNHIFRVRLNGVQYLPEFVSLQVGSPYGKAYFLKHAKRTTGIATINRTVLGAFPLLSPPVEAQRATVASVHMELDSARRAIAAASADLAAIEALPAALLREAFSSAA